MKQLCLVTLLCLVALSAAYYAPTPGQTFCGKYGGTNSTSQTAFLNTFLTRLFRGYAPSSVPGAFYAPLTAKYFNGSWSPTYPDYTTNTPFYNMLVNGFSSFFTNAWMCTALMSTGVGFLGQGCSALYSMFGFTPSIWNSFLTQINLALASMNVPMGIASNPLSEVAYVSAVLGPLNVVGATDYGQIVAGTDTFTTNNVWSNVFSYLSTSDTTVALGGSVSWRFASAHNVAQTSTLGGAVSPGGFRSGNLGIGSVYTYQFNTAGTYFYKCEQHSTMLGTITVTSTPFGYTSSSSTGGGGIGSVGSRVSICFASLFMAIVVIGLSQFVS